MKISVLRGALCGCMALASSHAVLAAPAAVAAPAAACSTSDRKFTDRMWLAIGETHAYCEFLCRNEVKRRHMRVRVANVASAAKEARPSSVNISAHISVIFPADLR